MLALDRKALKSNALLSLVIVTAAALLASGGCNSAANSSSTGPEKNASNKLNVLCTTGQVADMVRAVGGEYVQVETLMGPGVDPHLYRATLGDTQKLDQAQLVVYNGLHLEGRMAEVLENLAKRKPVFAVTEELVANSSDRLRQSADFEGHYDPHCWFDVALWQSCVGSVVRHLTKLDVAHEKQFQANGDDYSQKLQELDKWCREQLAGVPKEQRVLVTAHDAFGYFGKAYDIEVHGLQGISTVDEADLAGINRLVELLVSRKIKAVFVESSVPPKNVQSLIEGCAAKEHKVVEGGELYSDALGSAGSNAETYEGAVRHNVETIVKALK